MGRRVARRRAWLLFMPISSPECTSPPPDFLFVTTRLETFWGALSATENQAKARRLGPQPGHIYTVQSVDALVPSGELKLLLARGHCCGTCVRSYANHQAVLSRGRDGEGSGKARGVRPVAGAAHGAARRHG